MNDLAARIDRLESIESIRQLAAKYSLALDMRDGDAWVGLFPQDVRVGNGETGRAALRRWFDDTMRRQFSGTAPMSSPPTNSPPPGTSSCMISSAIRQAPSGSSMEGFMSK